MPPRRAAAFAVLLFALPASAAQETFLFDVGFRGLTAAQIAMTGSLRGASYAVSLRMESTGLVGIFREFAFAADSQGRMGRAQPAPRQASLRNETRRARGSITMRYPGGVPDVEIVPPREPQPWDLDAAQQTGRADPLSVIWAAFRAQPADRICDVTFRAFDGRRAGDLILSPPEARADGTMTCRGEWRRIAGYAPEDMAERTRFPFTLTWAPDGDRMRLIEMRARSRYGDAVLRRQ
ncbi:MAG: DUF3108 domain-containing protein [Pseudomonadota bacterium]